ncbi:MAG TPA: N-acetylglucosamine-6-phosphate deacetylase [Clostridia bacterium]|nr:N-acetylglucosamine-6-phosphate deacetylase [Clostridia bacterium]
MRTVFVNAKVITPYRLIAEDGGIIAEEGKIIEVFEDGKLEKLPDDTVIDAEGLYLSPGFIDIHTHGAGNADFMDGTVEAVCTACRTHMQYGTTSIVPTTLSSRQDEHYTNLKNIEKASKINDNMPEILGIHVEGPYFSPEQNGAQDSKHIREIDPEEYKNILEFCPFIIRWTVAPEVPGGLDMGRWLHENGIVASIGHSNAVYEDVVRACENGYSTITHFFNGMSRLIRKNALMYLGVAESGLLLDDLIVEIIADGKHLPPSLLKLIYKAKGADRICLVTDSMRAAGLDVNESIIGSLTNGQRVEIEDGVAYMPGRRSFGGSICTADRLIRTMVELADVPLVEAVKMLTLVPAKVLKVDNRKGSLMAGKDADIILFDEDINIKLVMVKGNVRVNKLWR